ncbi:MAG: hypothetical protein GWM92_13690 [Gemmatimonadetes bacterium]|nr:hypothetical protein [Gemmatimonadota bacterium]NIR79779.1 hypothetical protein [Gemmatimonadota bacterium]NIT88475.1 hypothetical protein [Gemmatimonadota bacterium]NIU32298.1 hypothetical protein [Gemmatimonadota bacterium]NIU36835.1 hypothetical protein [Gemmatimonadota bacterium]
MIYVGVLFALVALRWGLLWGGVLLLVPRVRACPACFDATVPVRRPWLRRLAPLLEWRWCPHCGWEGPGRRSENELVPDPSTPGPSRAGRSRSPRVMRRRPPRPGAEG